MHDMRRPPYLGLVLLAAAILALSVAVFRHYLPYIGAPLALREPPAVPLTIEDAYLVGLGERGKVWSLRAERVEIGQDRAQTTLTGITEGRIYDRGEPVLFVSAGVAVYNTRTESLDLSRGIHVTGNGGESVTALGASWDASTSTLTSSGEVRFRNEWSDVVTESLRADLNKKELTMWNVRLKAKLEGVESQAR